MALKIQLKDVEVKRDSLKLALTCLAKDLNGLIYNQESTAKSQKPPEASEKTSANDGPWEQVEKRKQRNANKIKAKNKSNPSMEKNKSGPSSNEENHCRRFNNQRIAKGLIKLSSKTARNCEKLPWCNNRRYEALPTTKLGSKTKGDSSSRRDERS